MKDRDHSEILEDIILLIYPLIILFGIYIVLSGNMFPGGGFQGGAVLAAVFMCRYLVYPGIMNGLDFIKKLDKVIMIFILAVASVFIITLFKDELEKLKISYNIIMNILIGIKVCSGLCVIFYTFIGIEGGKEN